ncbi:50S ribosomal protein L11 [archaeon]|nr:MAG: 50S ribosomal protein L11 [archaeon]
MGKKETLDLLVEGGKAAPGANSAPKLSAMKINVGDVFKQINDKTKAYAGMQVPVKVVIDADTKSFEITVGTPPVSSLIKKEIGVELAKITEEEKTAGKTIVGNMTMDQVVKVAKMKINALLAKDLKSAAKMVVGTANSMPMTVEGKRPKEVAKEIDEGKYDSLFA